MRYRGKKKLERFAGGLILSVILLCLTVVFLGKALLVLGGVAIAILLLIKPPPLFIRSKNLHPNANASVMPTLISGDGTYNHEIVGESNYKDSLREIMALTGTQGRYTTQANLILEDSNPHDHQAVMVCIQGKAVGYLSRAKALSFRRKYQHLGSNFLCNALLLGGDKQRRHIGVWLDI